MMITTTDNNFHAEEAEFMAQTEVNHALGNVPEAQPERAIGEPYVNYFDSEEVCEHVRESQHCKHGLGFTYDFCPIMNQVNNYAQLVLALTDALESLKRLPDVDGAYRQTCIKQAEEALSNARE
jgi:hypothetical protein